MRYGAFVEQVDHLGTRLADTAEQDLEVAVPTCPGWSASDLVRHVAQVYEHKIASTELQRVPDPWPPEWPADRDPVEWFRDAHGRLLAMFRSTSPPIRHRPGGPTTRRSGSGRAGWRTRRRSTVPTPSWRSV